MSQRVHGLLPGISGPSPWVTACRKQAAMHLITGEDGAGNVTCKLCIRVLAEDLERQLRDGAKYVISKRTRLYTAGPGSDGKVYSSRFEAERAAERGGARNPVGYSVEVFRPPPYRPGP